MRHCFKCNAFRSVAGGALCVDGYGRRRFICGGCLPKVSNRILRRFVARVKTAPGVSAAC